MSSRGLGNKKNDEGYVELRWTGTWLFARCVDILCCRQPWCSDSTPGHDVVRDNPESRKKKNNFPSTLWPSLTDYFVWPNRKRSGGKVLGLEESASYRSCTVVFTQSRHERDPSNAARPLHPRLFEADRNTASRSRKVFPKTSNSKLHIKSHIKLHIK